jgi:DNA-binding NarL/FixJ family response regulator
VPSEGSQASPEKTVRNGVSDVLGKLHTASRAEAVAPAPDAGLGPAPGA